MIRKLDSLFFEDRRKIFLLDSAGALLSFLILFLVIKPHQNSFGLPEHKVNILACSAFCFCAFSFLCYSITTIQRTGLVIIIVMNSLYALFTIGLLAIYRYELRVLGWIYFILELVVLLIIIRTEISVKNSWK